MRRKFEHRCVIKERPARDEETRLRNVSRKELVYVYNKFYKNQVAALYRAIHSS